MYKKFYGLNARPFRLSPDPQFFFTSKTHKTGQAYLRYGLHQGEGFIVITGEPGTGKTTLVHTLLPEISVRDLVIGEIVTSRLEPVDLLRSITTTFHLNSGGSKAELIIRFQEFLRDRARTKRRVVLIVDEAHNLPKTSLEELRMLCNLQHQSRAILQCVLVGQPPLWDTLNSANMQQLVQRIVAAHRLVPLDAVQTRDYILHRLRLSGWRGDPSFTASAIKLIHRYTRGIPRLINSLCERTLLFGALEDKHHFDINIMSEVYSEWSQETEVSDSREPVLLDVVSDEGIAGLGEETIRSA